MKANIKNENISLKQSNKNWCRNDNNNNNDRLTAFDPGQPG